MTVTQTTMRGKNVADSPTFDLEANWPWGEVGRSSDNTSSSSEQDDHPAAAREERSCGRTPDGERCKEFKHT